MWLDDPPLATVFRRRENDGEPVNDRRLRKQLDRGEVVRIAPGSFAGSTAWAALTPLQQHAQRVWEMSARLHPSRVISHFAAAALHGIDILGSWPTMLDVSIESSRGGRSSGAVRRRSRDLGAVATQPWGRHEVTTATQTALDLMSTLRFMQGVAAADQALWARRSPQPLVGVDALAEKVEAVTGPGSARARRAADFATSLADSVRESQSRVIISMLGFPAPELQARFVLSDGRDAFTDFFWREHSHIGEFDGAGKYRDPVILAGRAREDVLLAEKDREDDLRRQVAAFSRWRVPALKSPRMLYDILAGAGLPSSRPRPGR